MPKAIKCGVGIILLLAISVAGLWIYRREGRNVQEGKVELKPAGVKLSHERKLPFHKRRKILNEDGSSHARLLNDVLSSPETALGRSMMDAVLSLYLVDLTGATLEELLNDRNEELKVKSAMLLAFSGDDRGRQVLESALKRPSVLLQLYAGAGLVALGDENAIEVLARLLNSESWGLRLEAVKTIGLTGQPALLQLLKPMLNDSSYNVRIATAGSMLRLGDDSAKDVLYQALKSPDSAQRYMAAFPLAEAGDPAPLEFLRYEFEHYDLSVKARCAYYMALLGDLSGVPSLYEAKEKGDDETRAFAIAALAALSNPH